MILKKSTSFYCFLSLMFFIGVGQSSCEKEDLIHYSEESEHFVVQSNSALASAEEVGGVLQKSEEIYEGLRLFFGVEHDPDRQIYIYLEGYERDNGSYVDSLGVHLYKYSQEEGGYFVALAHEIVHAYNMPWHIGKDSWMWSTYAFFDEGIAEYAAQIVDSTKHGYPFYGFPEEVVVGSILKMGYHIPFDTMRNYHTELNLKCLIQMYTPRASWMRHLDEEFGREALLKVIFPPAEPTNEVVESLIGVDLTQLDTLWEDWVLNKYENYPMADALAAEYWAKVSWYSFCIEGRDY